MAEILPAGRLRTAPLLRAEVEPDEAGLPGDVFVPLVVTCRVRDGR
jgi:hypothetical protein